MYGIFNQKGFILPITLIICLLFPIVLVAGIEAYKVEQRFYVEEEQMEMLQRLTQIGFVDIYHLISEMDSTEMDEMTGSFHYPFGSVQYNIEPIEEHVIRIQGTSVTNKQRKQFFVAIINIETKEFEKWVEE